MREFKSFHPIVSFIYFVAVIGFSMVLLHPACTALSLAFGIVIPGLLKGFKGLGKTILWILIVILFGAVFNGLFNHQGVTILCYLPDGNPLTMEAVLYGGVAAAMIGAVICWFSCFSDVFTSEKLMYLFGRVMPSFALIFSMTLRLADKFKRLLKDIADSQKGIPDCVAKNSSKDRLKNTIRVLSTGTSGMLEDSVETVNSMKARGYGLKDRTTFSLFKFEKRDGIMLTVVIILAVVVCIGAALKVFRFECFPIVKTEMITMDNAGAYAAYLLLLALPGLIEIWGEIKWKLLK